MAALRFKSIVGKKQKADLKALQLVCLPNDAPLECHPNGCAIGVYDGSQMVAFALAKPSSGYAATMYLSRAGVHPDYRGRGLQKTLIGLRETWARKRGMKHAITDTANHSVASMRSLIAAGYRPFWPTIFKPWALRGSIYWRKDL